MPSSFDATIGGETAASGEVLINGHYNQHLRVMFGLSDSLFLCDTAWYIVVSNVHKTGGQGNCVLGTLPEIQGDCRTKNIRTIDFVW